MWEGVGDWTELQYIDPQSYGHQRCVFLVLQGYSTGGLGPSPLGAVLSTASCYQRVWSPKLTDFLSSPSYIIVQSPTQYLPITGHRNVSLPLSLDGMFDRHWAEITVMQFTGHSLLVHQFVLYRGILTLSHILNQACPRQWNMHFCRLWNGMFGGVAGQYTRILSDV